MSHITQEQAIELARGAELDWHAGYLLDDERDNRYHTLCNAAIEWHIAQQAASVDATFKKWNAEHEPENEPAVSLASQRPINCGTGHCSCIECLYKKDQKTNTSQERVQKPAEFIQMLEAAYLAGFNESGEGYNGEYGANTAHPAWIKDRDNTLASITTGGTV